MKLLTPEQTKIEKTRADDERIDRINRLRNEEQELVRSLNQTREYVASEKQRLADELSEHALSVSLTKQELSQEVAALESRRKDALKPIHELRAEVEARSEQVDIREKELERREDAVREAKTTLAERVGVVEDREQECREREADLHKREIRILNEEHALKTSSQTLQEKWLDYHSTVNATIRDIAQEKLLVETARKANDDLHASILKEKERVRQEDIAVRDKYRALAQAKKHLGIPE